MSIYRRSLLGMMVLFAILISQAALPRSTWAQVQNSPSGQNSGGGPTASNNTGATPAQTGGVSAVSNCSSTGDGEETCSSEGAAAPATTNSGITPFVPRLSVPIAGVEFTTPTVNAPYVEVPFIAQYITGIYRYGIGIVTIVAIIMVIYGGFKYLLSGTVKGVSDGKEILQDVMGGMVVLFCAYLLLYFVNPKLVQLPTFRVRAVSSIPAPTESGDESVGRDSAEGAPSAPGRGPSSFCRENLVATQHRRTSTVWCAGCGSGCTVIETGRPDRACAALVGQCGGAFGPFLKALTDNCVSKTFGWLETLDGGTFGIRHYLYSSLDTLLPSLQRRDPAAYARVMAAGNNQPVTEQALCASQRNDRGFVCNAGYRAMLVAALRERSFTLVQLEELYNTYNQRANIARSQGFNSPYGQAMVAVMLNNPGACGGGLQPLQSACRQTDESARIDCYLQKFVEVPCRGSADGARNRVESIRTNLSGLSRSGAAGSVTLQQLEACVP